MTRGKLNEFSWDSAWWIFNLTANYANLKYSYMVKDIRKVQKELESNFLTLQPAIEATAIKLLKDNPELARRFLTDYSVTRGNLVFTRWQELARYLITKYNDGYIQKKPGRPSEEGYPDTWLKRVIEEKPEQFRLKEKKTGVSESKLVD
jgi:dipeptidase